jgi:hypothetical protein
VISLSHWEQNKKIKKIMDNSNNKFTPAVIYSNALIAKSQILKDNKGKTGIYQWTHLESGKFYVGSAFDLSKRLNNYYKRSNLTRNSNSIINNAILNHGYSSFSVTIMEYIDISNLTKAEARVRCSLLAINNITLTSFLLGLY